MRHTVVKPRYTSMKNQSEISWQFPAHPPPQRLRNYNEQAKIIFRFRLPRLAEPGQKRQYCWLYGMYHRPVLVLVLIKQYSYSDPCRVRVNSGIGIEVGGIENPGIGMELKTGIEFLQLLPQQLIVNQQFPNVSFNRGGHNLSCDNKYQLNSMHQQNCYHCWINKCFKGLG